MDRFESFAQQLRAEMEAVNTAREIALRECREVIRYSSIGIRALHRLEFEEARKLIDEARRYTESVKHGTRKYPELYYAGYVHDSQKEYVEAEAMFAIIQNLDLPSPSELGVEPAAYLNGLAEAGSECRRYVLDRLRKGEFDIADRILQVMDDIYFEMITFDYPDAITGGLRRTTDAFRAVLERTRGDLALTMRQHSLEETLQRVLAKWNSNEAC